MFISNQIAEERQRGRFAGFSLFISNNGVRNGSTQCYKNGSELPVLNFTITCTEYGRYVIFYNERLQGVTYPKGYELFNVYNELCEVIVLGINVNHIDFKGEISASAFITPIGENKIKMLWNNINSFC